MSKLNEIDPPESEPAHELPENQQPEEGQILNTMLAEQSAQYARLVDCQSKVLAKIKNRNREGRQEETDQQRDQEDMG